METQGNRGEGVLLNNEGGTPHESRVESAVDAFVHGGPSCNDVFAWLGRSCCCWRRQEGSGSATGEKETTPILSKSTACLRGDASLLRNT